MQVSNSLVNLLPVAFGGLSLQVLYLTVVALASLFVQLELQFEGKPKAPWN